MSFVPHLDLNTILILAVGCAFGCGAGISDAIAKSERLKQNGLSQLIFAAFSAGCSAAKQAVLVNSGPIGRKLEAIAEEHIEEMAERHMEKSAATDSASPGCQPEQQPPLPISQAHEAPPEVQVMRGDH